MNRNVHFPARACALGGLAIVLLAACGAGGDASGENVRGQDVTPAVEVVAARLDALPLRERFTGIVEAAGQVEIYPETSGRIVEVYAQNGDVVQAGERLVRIESVAPRSQLQQAEAGLSVARAEARAAQASVEELESQFRRTQLLAADSLVSQEEVEAQRTQLEAARAAAAQAEAQVASARAAIDERQDALGRTIVRAPISGVVGQRSAEVGMIADGSAPLFTIGNLDEMRVELPIAQDLIGRIQPGQRAEIRTDVQPTATLEAAVSRISPFLAEGSFSAEAEIDIDTPAGRLVPGMFVTVDVFYGESDSTTVVPTSALWDDPDSGELGVWVAEPPVPAERLTPENGEGAGTLTEPAPTRFVGVEVVAEGRQTVGISGIRPEQWVVVIGQHLLARDAAAGEPVARLRVSTWDRIIRLQERQGPELLREVMEEHRARVANPEVPASNLSSDGRDR